MLEGRKSGEKSTYRGTISGAIIHCATFVEPPRAVLTPEEGIFQPPEPIPSGVATQTLAGELKTTESL